MPSLNPFQDELLSDDDHSWRQHVLWQSAALAPNEAADLELNKAVDEVGISSYHFANSLPAHLRFLFTAYCAVCALFAGAESIAAVGTLLGLIEVDIQYQQLLKVLWLSVACMLACELPLLLVVARKEADTCRFDRWLALDLASLLITAVALVASQQLPTSLFEACAGILALRFALQPLRARLANAGGTGGSGASVRSLRSTDDRSGGGITFDTDLGFDNTSCCSSSELRAERTLEAKQDSGFESSSYCSTSELKAERALEAKQASEAGFFGAKLDLNRDFEFDDIDAGWLCVSCGMLNIGDSPSGSRICACQASSVHEGDL